MDINWRKTLEVVRLGTGWRGGGGEDGEREGMIESGGEASYYSFRLTIKLMEKKNLTAISFLKSKELREKY
jgi:hypothetical protein